MDISKLKKELIEQKNSKFKGNIYHYSQVNFAYNSNKIEGSHLSEDETEEIFETNSFISKNDNTLYFDDLIEFHVRVECIHPFGDENEYLRQKMTYFQNSYLLM